MNALAEKINPYKPQFRLTARIGVSALISWLIMHNFGMQQGYWMVLTSIIVTQASVGSTVKAAIERMVGTFAGAAYGTLICSLSEHQNMPELFPLWIILGLAPTAFLAAVKPSFKIAPITVAIMLFGTGAANLSPVVYAEHRVVEIGIGCIIGLLVSLIIFPARAHKTLAGAASKVLETYASLVSRLLEIAAAQLDYTAVEGTNTAIRLALTKLEAVGEEAKRERKHMLTTEPDPEPLLRIIRRVRNDLIIVGRAVNLPLPVPAIDALAAPLNDVAQACNALLINAAGALPADKPAPVPENYDAAFERLSLAFTNFHRQRRPGALPENDIRRIYALSFALEQLQGNLKDLAARVTDFTAEESESKLAV